MSLTLPSEGQSNWDVPLNDALANLDERVDAAQTDADAAAGAAQSALDRANHTGTQSADTITDGATNKAYTATEKNKLNGIATGATANSADANLLNRANHTGTQVAATISDLLTVVDDHLDLGTAAQADAADFEAAGAAAAHTGDTTDAHDASAISFTPAGSISATDVQSAIEEVAAEAAAGGGSLLWMSRKTKTDGDVAVSSLTAVALDVTLDITQPVAAGDWLLVGVHGSWAATGTSFGIIHIASVVGGAAVNYVGTTSAGYGVPGWLGRPSVGTSAAGGMPFQVQAGDISGGNITLRVYVRLDSASSKTLSASTLVPFTVWAINLGQ